MNAPFLQASNVYESTRKMHLYEPQNHQLQHWGTQPYNGVDMILEQVPPLQHHHHHYSALSLDGQTGMTSPAEKPPMPKSKFTPADDELLVNLKENSSLTWKQIAEFFPGRSAGTLQVRYCTKLKAKTPQWTNETTQRLRVAIQDYEQKKWGIIAGKMGKGFTGKACQDKANQL